MIKFLALVLVPLIGLVVLWLVLTSGVFNISAVHPEHTATEALLDRVMEASVRRHAKGVVSTAIPDAEAFGTGYAHYRAMCEVCHAAPGVERSEIARGLYPAPPDLSVEAAEWSAEEVFWIIQNGIKMTGMPAFGPTHTDRELWAITAFVKKLPGMSPQTYDSLNPAPPDTLPALPRASEDGHRH